MGTTHLDIRGLGYQEESLRKAVRLNIPALLIGETGTGKTSLVKKLAQDEKKTVVRVNLNGSTSIDEFVGKYILKNDEMVWIDGVLTTCMRKGHWILVDEINAALPEILFVLHSLLDDERAILLSEKDGELVKSHKDFRFFATMNPVDEYAGTKDLNKALLSRFGVVLKVDYVDYTTEVEIVRSRSDIDFDTAKKIVTFAVKTREMKAKEEIFNCMSTRDAIGIALLIKDGESYNSAMNLVFSNKLSNEELMKFATPDMANGIAGIKSYFTQDEIAKAKQDGIEAERKATQYIVDQLNKQLERLGGKAKPSVPSVKTSGKDEIDWDNFPPDIDKEAFKREREEKYKQALRRILKDGGSYKAPEPSAFGKLSKDTKYVDLGEVE